ncbi:MAG: murein transglycosylase A [Alphaproteobacteria bacterium]
MRLEAKTKRLFLKTPSLLALIFLAGCGGQGLVPPKEKFFLVPVPFDELPGWSHDAHFEALEPFRKSCLEILRRPASLFFGTKRFGSLKVWRKTCLKLKPEKFKIPHYGRRFFEKNFQPFLVSDKHARAAIGLFTGYFEPEIRGALRQHGEFQTPIYMPPYDLKEKRDRYLSRREIDRGAIKNIAKTIAWAADPIDAFFLHIQGSGRIRLPNNRIIRVGYAGHNRHPYTAIGKVLIKRGILSKANISMQSIRAWLARDLVQAQEVMQLNARYVFFRVLRGGGPVGAQGVVLTAGRSLAVDPKFISYGVPIWLDTRAALAAERPLQRLLIAQDTGGAIKGIVRGDIFFGHGRLAAKRAGYMNRRGRYYVLIP